MPLTTFQATLASMLAINRSPDSYLAGGAAIHLQPNTTRYSNDLDFFQDSVERVASAFAQDSARLAAVGYTVEISINQPGYIRAFVQKDEERTKVEWAHDSAWRFLPPIVDAVVGYRLHPLDLATNKILALVGRNEPRDFIDILYFHRTTLSLGAICWAAVGKDPGFTPLSLLEMLRRRGVYRPEDFSRLHLVGPVNIVGQKTEWLHALDSAERFIRSRPPTQMGCLYYSPREKIFVEPTGAADDDSVPHFGRPGGVLPHVEE